MAIQHRRGAFNKFDPTRLLPGEWAVVLSGDENASDGRAVYICFAAGAVKRVATFEDMAEAIANATDSIVEQMTGDVSKAVERADAAAQTCESGESVRVASESTRVANEEARVSAESTRASSEQSRATAEQSRASAETTRAAKETTRQQAEQNRETAESSRVSAESARVAAEESRASAEASRVTAEEARVSAEADRVEAEGDRAEAESTRATSEASRVTAEARRVAEFEEIRQRSRGWLYCYCEAGEYDPVTRKPVVEAPDAGTLYFTPVENPTDSNRWLEWSWDALNNRWEQQGVAEMDVSSTPLTTAQIDGLLNDDPPQGSEVLSGAGLSYLWALLGTATVGQVLGGD